MDNQLDVAKRERRITSPNLGVFLRKLIADRHLTLKEVYSKCGMRPAQMSYVLKGGNVQLDSYEKIAKALRFRDAFAMLTSGGDGQTARLLQLWRALPSPEARKDALDLMLRSFEAALEPAATADAAPDAAPPGRGSKAKPPRPR